MLLEVKNIKKSYRKGGMFSNKKQLILNDISFNLEKGKCLGIIGESGSGKSTLGRLILGIEKPDSGIILFNGNDVQKVSTRLGNMSVVFQDYTSSINPQFTVFEAIKEIMKLQGKIPVSDMKSHTIELLKQVGLDESYLNKKPHELSGGEAQRVCIARAISTKPEFLLLDESISALDVSIQAQVLELLKKLKEELNMTYLFITHDIQAVTFICDEVIFFQAGKIVEHVDVCNLSNVKNEYSKKLLSVVIPI